MFLWDLLREPTPPVRPREPDSSTVPRWSISLSDHLGSTTLVTDVQGQVIETASYTPFGEISYEIRDTKYASRFLFTGQEWDKTELYYFGARYYDPTLSQFMSVDPIDQYPRDPYTYTQNNPILYTDPQGKQRLHLEDLIQIRGSLADHREEAVTWQEFIEFAQRENWSTPESMLGQLRFEETSKVNNKNYRYVIDPGNSEAVIDMVHFLAIREITLLLGKWFGELGGLEVEAEQLLSPLLGPWLPSWLKERLPSRFQSKAQERKGKWKSAFQLQDFFSNAGGAVFFGDLYDPKKDFLEQLGFFFEQRTTWHLLTTRVLENLEEEERPILRSVFKQLFSFYDPMVFMEEVPEERDSTSP
jgi:RHS repeat-associated protein